MPLSAQPHPTDHLGLVRIPGPTLSAVAIRYSSLSDRANFNPTNWPSRPLTPSKSFLGWWEIDLDLLGLVEGVYEYEFLATTGEGIKVVVADPYAEELTRFGGYRGLFTIVEGKRQRRTFDWRGEFAAGVALPNNNQIVIYEMPIKWMASDPGPENAPLVELGTIDKVIFEHLDDLASIGINCIELLPIQDSPQTLNWGYGTRFFFAPDYDVASVIDLKFFVKQCHTRGIRIILDVVMNMFAPPCPLTTLALPWYSVAASAGRQDYSQELFLYDVPSYGSYYAAREFLCEMAEYWVNEYHIDGYRIDDFADINNWDFVQEFRDRATNANQSLRPGTPFLVIAEDSSTRFVTTSNDVSNPNGRVVVDALWHFTYRSEIRRLLTDSLATSFGQPARSTRVQHLISKDGVWDDVPKVFTRGYADMTCAIDYITSHDVADACRLMNLILGPALQAANLGNGGIQNVASVLDGADSSNATIRAVVDAALRRVFGAFALLMTSVGIPMFLAGEEFGDVHDTSYTDVNEKQQDPVQWARAQYKGNSLLKANVAKLIGLRTSHPALQRNDVTAFYFHPRFDDDSPAPRVFAYCRTAGQALGTAGQVIVIANMGADSFPTYSIPSWPWQGQSLKEVGYPATAPVYDSGSGIISLSLTAFSARVFTT